MDAPPPGSQVRRATMWMMVLAAVYIAALWWLDRDKHIQLHLAALAGSLAVAAAPVFLSYIVRYARWRYLLRRQGERFPYGAGFLAYLSGFAFTATPGKTGELIRIRYYARLGIAPERTFGVFVFERALDLLVILLLSLLAATLVPGFDTLAVVVPVFLAALVMVALWPPLRHGLARLVAALPFALLRRLGEFLLQGADELGRFLRPTDSLVGILAGAVAWLLTSLVFAGLLQAMGFALPWSVALGIYPLAMLVGALSFAPGGVGTTELAIVLMLGRLGITTGDAVVVAVGVRLVTLWFAVAVGMLAMLLLEWRPPATSKGRGPTLPL